MAEQILGTASYYDNSSVDPRWGGATKSGEQFNENLPTVAVAPNRWKELKGKKVRVTNTKNGKSVVVKVNDTGGFEKYGRVADLSKSAFASIEDTKKGTAKVRIDVLENLLGNN